MVRKENSFTNFSVSSPISIDKRKEREERKGEEEGEQRLKRVSL